MPGCPPKWPDHFVLPTFSVVANLIFSQSDGKKKSPNRCLVLICIPLITVKMSVFSYVCGPFFFFFFLLILVSSFLVLTLFWGVCLFLIGLLCFFFLYVLCVNSLLYTLHRKRLGCSTLSVSKGIRY